jgi:hypothetical protein
VYSDRVNYYAELEEARNSRVLVCVTGDRGGLETRITSDLIPLFAHHMDSLSSPGRNKLSLLLYTGGGDVLTAWNIVNLIKQFFDDFEVIVPFKAFSAGTLICLGADNIILTKQATLGPIDPSVSTALNPKMPSTNTPFPVSVEDVNGYLEFAKVAVGAKNSAGIAALTSHLATEVHPLVLGRVFRSRGQIRMLAERLLSGKLQKAKLVKCLSFLCGDSGSHDYPIHRKEAREILGLPATKPTDSEYKIIKSIYDDISKELALTSPFNVAIESSRIPTGHSQYLFKRGLVESVVGGSYCFESEVVLAKSQTQAANGGTQQSLEVQTKREGWTYYEPIKA